MKDLGYSRVNSHALTKSFLFSIVNEVFTLLAMNVSRLSFFSASHYLPRLRTYKLIQTAQKVFCTQIQLIIDFTRSQLFKKSRPM